MVTQLVIHILLILCLSKADALSSSLAKPGCQESCGNVSIPYPFGIGSGCSIDTRFAVTCNNSFNPPKPFIYSSNLQLLEVKLQEGTLRVNSTITSSNCPNRETGQVINLRRTPFFFSETKNSFTAMGCDNLALLNSEGSSIGGCLSICNSNTNGSGCYGVNCCQTRIPAWLNYINITFGSTDLKNETRICKSAFVAEQEWFSSISVNGTDIRAVQNLDYIPVVLEWTISNGTCELSAGMNSSTSNSSMAFCSANAYCSSVKYFPNHLCFCNQGYEGNPYLSEGCRDIDECVDPKSNNCEMICTNTPGSYECSCPSGYEQNENRCLKLANKSQVVILAAAASIGLIGILLSFIGTWWLSKVIKRRKEAMQKEKFFKRNGGLLLQQQLSSGEGNVKKTTLFSSKELEKATDYYNENRILGKGGQGTVYKGMLTDGRIVAIKISKMVDEGQLEQFINEVVILSQINHRNVVKLLGCCLETEVPLLVYEFISNGTLFQYIHDQNEEFSVSWETNLRIATEVAGALYYLHSAASIPIYHRDIKSTNILLDDKYRAKVSDFGTSRSIAVDQTHLTTLVRGTFGYLDPEYFQSSQFTEKSDVYSFGVVLVELLTGQKPISSTNSQEKRSLATHFIFSMKENCLFDILDTRVVKEDGKEEIIAVANLAKRCLNLNGKKRPTMKEVTMELEAIKRSDGGFTFQQNYEEVEYAMTELICPWDAASTSTGSYMDHHVASSSLEVQSLLFNKSS